MIRNGFVRIGLALAAAVAVYIWAMARIDVSHLPGVLRVSLQVIAAVAGIALALVTAAYLLMLRMAVLPPKTQRPVDPQALVPSDIRERWVLVSHVEALQLLTAGMV